jgi:YegS/Rv2252/BmrU family lipid kinase
MLPAMPGTVVVVNPHSAGRKTEKRWPQLREIIHEAYGPFETRFTDKPGSATTLTRDALKSGAELVVAIGGDGTINEVVNGFYEGTRAIAPQASFGVLPAGTGGDFVKTLGTSRDIRTAASDLRSAQPRAIDLGRLTFVGNDGKTEVRHFINVASFGIGGLVDKYVNESSKALGGTLSFAISTLKAGLNYKNAEVRVVIDDAPAREGRIYNIAVANGRYFGGGMKIAPDAALDDGLFDVVTLGDFHFSDLLLRGLDIYTGKHVHNPKVTVHRARRVEATATNGSHVLLDVDGEAPGRLPATFEMVPGGLKVRARR